MPQEKPAIDYKQLPFEVHYKQIDCHRYEFMADAGQAVGSYTDCTAVRKVYLRSYGVTFACNDPSGGKLLYVLAGRLDEFIPDWLEVVDEEDEDAKSQDYFRFTVDGSQLTLLDELDYEECEDSDGNELYEPVGIGSDFYSVEGYKPAYLVLDADNSRLVVDCEGYVLGEDDTRIGKKPVVPFTEDDVDNCECAGLDYIGISMSLANVYRGPIMIYDEDSD